MRSRLSHGCRSVEHWQCFAMWFSGTAMQPATSHITLMLHATSGTTGPAWLSARRSYGQLACEMWALFRSNPLMCVSWYAEKRDTGCERNCLSRIADRTKGPPDAPGGDAIPRLLNSGAATSSGRPRIQTACQKLKPVSSSGFLQFQHKRHAGESRRHDRADHAQLLLARPRSAIVCRAPCGHCTRACDQQGRRSQGLVLVPCCPLTMRRLR